MCKHTPPYPTSDAPDRQAARVSAAHPEQADLLCNGVLLFEDTGGLQPDGQIIEPHNAPSWMGF
ncbi:DUF5999 family protein [Streptomyces sp. NPDC088729]|uniref:DUF5999 family protein n=1 Tax=Streptomyces sp. NPDC088729 TaxID=3365876 RepID=UPI0038294980